MSLRNGEETLILPPQFPPARLIPDMTGGQTETESVCALYGIKRIVETDAQMLARLKALSFGDDPERAFIHQVWVDLLEQDQ